MSGPLGYPNWEELYRHAVIEDLPWYSRALDQDLDAALARHEITSGRLLDLGTGPGIHATALAQRGFTVTGADVSEAALEHATKRAKASGVQVTFVQDDILASRLTGPFDIVLDRGCFHVFPPEARAVYAQTIHRLLVPGGWLLLKTFSHLQPGDEEIPYRFTPDDLRGVFEDRGFFEAVDILDALPDGGPKSLFASMRRRA